MANMSNAIKNTVSISLFNKGQAGKIFEEVKKTGTKVVMKNNNPECVLLAIEEYLEFMEEVENARLLAKALERLEESKLEDAISQEEILKQFNISQEDLKDFDKVEIE